MSGPRPGGGPAWAIERQGPGGGGGGGLLRGDDKAK